MRLRSQQCENRLDEMNRMTGMCDFEEFVGDLEDVYYEEKRRVGRLTERTKNVLGEKFSLTFQNNYAQLSTRFDSLIQKAQLNFTTHLPPIQDLQQPITHILPYLPNPIYPHLLSIISNLLLSSQSLYHHYIKQQVLTIKEQLQTIVLKNYQLEEEITNVYELYEEMKEKLDEEGSYRVELERHLVSLEREIVNVREENYELGRVNKELLESKHELDEVMQVTKQQQTTLKTSHLLNTDRLKQQQSKLLSLTQQNMTLHHQILSLRHQLQQAKFQQQNFIEQINHLKETLDNRNYELDIYKNRQLRESPSNNNLYSHDKLNNYNQLLLEHYQPRSVCYQGPCYNMSSEKSSLRSFMLSHQKSMGKLTIFESREQQHYQQNLHQLSSRMLEKVSSCRKSLQSFQRDNNEVSEDQCEKESPMKLGFVFPLMNQLTFRPVLQNQSCNQKQLKQNKIWTQTRRTEIKKDSTYQESHLIETQPQHHKKYIQTPSSDQQLLIQPRATAEDYPYIQPLVFSGRKGSQQLSRSKSITEVHNHQHPSAFILSKRLIYEGHESENVSQSGEQIATSTYQNIDSISNPIITQDTNHNSSNHDNQSHFSPLTKNNHIHRTSSSKKQFHNHHHHSQQINIQQLIDQIRQTKVFNDNDCGEGNEVKSSRFIQQPEQPNENNNNRSIIKNKSHSRIVAINCNNQWQNKSDTNSVNRALIKKSIKAQRQMSQLVQKLQKLQTQNDQYSQKLIQLQYKLTYYKQQLLKSSLECINQKSIVQNKQVQIELMNEEIKELQERLMENEELLKKKEYVIEELEGGLGEVQNKYQERLKKVKQHCREYIEKRHQQEVTQIVQCYEEELKILTQKIQSMMMQKYQQPQISYRDVESITNIPNLLLVPSITNLTIHVLDKPSFINKKNNQSIAIQSSVVDVKCCNNGESKPVASLSSCTQCINVVIDPQVYRDYIQGEGKSQLFSKAQVLREKLCMNSAQYSLSIHFPQHQSPSLQKKLLNTPSTTNYASQTNHQPTPTKSSQFPHTPFAAYPHSPQQQLIPQNDSFHTVLSHISNQKQSPPISSSQSILSQAFQQNQPMQSFFTCIQFSNESIIQMRKSNSYSSNTFQIDWKQQVLSEDILFVAQNQNNKYKSLTIVQSSAQRKDFILEDAVKDNASAEQNKTQTKQQSCQLKILNPSKISQFIEVQQDPIIRSHASSKLIKKSSQPFYKVTIPSQQCMNLANDKAQFSENFYSKSFEKHLSTYFKKHTNFLFSDKHFQKGFIPDVDKIYILHCVKSTTSQIMQDSDKENDDKFIGTQCFLLYNRLLVNLQSGRKLQLPKSSMLKFITDETRLALGNFEITITSQFTLKVSRKNKRCFYMGSLDDGTWQITKLQEIISLPYNLKK